MAELKESPTDHTPMGDCCLSETVGNFQPTSRKLPTDSRKFPIVYPKP